MLDWILKRPRNVVLIDGEKAENIQKGAQEWSIVDMFEFY